MRQNIFYRIVLAAIGLAFLVSCEENFLEISPKGKLIADKTSDYALMLNDLSVLGNQLFNLPQTLGDELAVYEPYINGMTVIQQRTFRYEDNIYQADDNAPEITSPMKAIYVYNVIINEVLNSKEGTQSEKLEIQAEAKGGRAWSYFQLINLFAKPYVSSTAAADPGFPIIKQADVNAENFERASVQQVYDFIIADLTEAIPYLPENPVHRFKMSKPAAQAILGKVYLTMNKQHEALEQFNMAVVNVEKATYSLRLYDYNQTFATGGQFLPISIVGPSFPNLYNNFESLYSRQAFGEWTVARNEILISPETAALYSANDLRLNFFSRTPYPSGSSFPLGMMRRNGPSSPIIGLLLPDLYLLRAECRARNGELAGAVSDLELLRKKRMPAQNALIPAAVSSDKITLLRFIFNERLREFAGLGYRWFDMRRLSVDADLSDMISTVHKVYGANGNIISTYNLPEKRLTLKIPPKVLQQNPAMIDNP